MISNRPVKASCGGADVSRRDIIEEALKEKRRFRRIRLTPKRKGLFSGDCPGKRNASWKDISAGGAFIHCKFLRQPGNQAVVYLDELGQFEGRITALKKDAFTMAFTCSRRKRDKLADKLHRRTQPSICSAGTWRNISETYGETGQRQDAFWRREPSLRQNEKLKPRALHLRGLR